MVCDVCGKNEATVFVTQVVNQKVKKLHLCGECAAHNGLDIESSMAEILLGVGMNKEEHAEKPVPDKVCPQCHMQYSDFKKTSRLGCPGCYQAFAEELDLLLESMHRGKQHVGKTPQHAADSPPGMATLAALKQALDVAVGAEQYEEAARLRDQIRRRAETAGGTPAKRSRGS